MPEKGAYNEYGSCRSPNNTCFSRRRREECRTRTRGEDDMEWEAHSIYGAENG